MPDPVEQIREFLRVSSSTDRMTVTRYVLERGRAFEPAPFPEGFVHGELKRCYRNAFQFAVDEGYGYAEGFAVWHLMPVLHAWCVDPDGRAIDPTWPEAEKCAYFGIEFPIEQIAAAVIRRNCYGSIIDEWEEGWPLLREYEEERNAARG